jgi:DNA repair exonuclease SbcCD nuclease subunit
MVIRLVHCTDVHLDKFFDFGDPAKGEIRRKDIENNFIKIIDFTIKQKADIFLLTGDIFDKVKPSNSSRSFLANQIKRLNDEGIQSYAIGGNHDAPKIGNETLAIDILRATGIAHVFNDSETFQEEIITIGDEKIQIIGKSYYIKNQNQNPFENYNIKKKADYLICLLHGTLTGMNVGPSNLHNTEYNPFPTNDINPEIDYLALGHFHNYFERKKDNTVICNSGSIEKLTWSEANDEKKFVLIELDRGNCNIKQITLQTRDYENIEIKLDTKIVDIKSHIIEKIKPSSNNDKILRIRTDGEISVKAQKDFRVSELIREANKLFFHAYFVPEHGIEGIGKVFLGKMESPIKTFEMHFDKLIANETNDIQREFLQKAKETGLIYLGELNDIQ